MLKHGTVMQYVTYMGIIPSQPQEIRKINKTVGMEKSTHSDYTKELKSIRSHDEVTFFEKTNKGSAKLKILLAMTKL